MKQILKELFGETGDLSMMRLMCFIAVCAAVGLAFMGKDSSVVVFLTAAFGGKTAQKYVENKDPS